MVTMDTAAEEELHYSIWDPAGNITALVESNVLITDQPTAAAKIMSCHPEVEQVGFVRCYPEQSDTQAELRMAGGEFCGNASMCAAALFVQKHFTFDKQAPRHVKLRVSSSSEVISVQIEPKTLSCVNALIRIPEAVSIRKRTFSVDGIQYLLSVVRMEGISHIVISQQSELFGMLEDRGMAEEAVKRWCTELAADCLGLMFLKNMETVCELTPLVYVPACETTFWENSCASGTASVGMFLSDEKKSGISLDIREPGGCIRVISDRTESKTYLSEKVYFLGSYPE